jgi:hypothetical protein
MTQGGYPPQLEFFWKFFSGFENFNNFKCHLKAFRSRIKHSKVLKTHQGVISTFIKKKIKFLKILIPLKFISGGNPGRLLNMRMHGYCHIHFS